MQTTITKRVEFVSACGSGRVELAQFRDGFVELYAERGEVSRLAWFELNDGWIQLGGIRSYTVGAKDAERVGAFLQEAVPQLEQRAGTDAVCSVLEDLLAEFEGKPADPDFPGYEQYGTA